VTRNKNIVGSFDLLLPGTNIEHKHPPSVWIKLETPVGFLRRLYLTFRWKWMNMDSLPLHKKWPGLQHSRPVAPNAGDVLQVVHLPTELWRTGHGARIGGGLLSLLTFSCPIMYQIQCISIWIRNQLHEMQNVFSFICLWISKKCPRWLLYI